MPFSCTHRQTCKVEATPFAAAYLNSRDLGSKSPKLVDSPWEQN